jgi:hypothetical protein
MRKLTSKAPTRGNGAEECAPAGSFAKCAAATAEPDERKEGGGGGGRRPGVNDLPDQGFVDLKDEVLLVAAVHFLGEAADGMFTLRTTVDCTAALRACRPAWSRSAADW